jgi:hypothetical protein
MTNPGTARRSVVVVALELHKASKECCWYVHTTRNDTGCQSHQNSFLGVEAQWSRAMRELIVKPMVRLLSPLQQDALNSVVMSLKAL